MEDIPFWVHFSCCFDNAMGRPMVKLSVGRSVGSASGTVGRMAGQAGREEGEAQRQRRQTILMPDMNVCLVLLRLVLEGQASMDPNP